MRRGPSGTLVLRQNPDADLPGRYPDDEGENDRSLITSDAKPDRSNRHQLSDQVSANTHIGDAVMALFGAPRAHDDDPYARRPRRLDVLGFFLKCMFANTAQMITLPVVKPTSRPTLVIVPV